MESDEYLGAFLGGVEFVLLAIEGRLQAGEIDEETAARLKAFIEDYQLVLDRHRESRTERHDITVQRLVLPLLDAQRN